MRDLINQKASTTNVNYGHCVTAVDGALGEQHLRDFQDNEKSIPTILTTSQKLSTGVDAPEVRNIILLRPVNSMVEFKQIIGREHASLKARIISRCMTSWRRTIISKTPSGMGLMVLRKTVHIWTN